MFQAFMETVEHAEDLRQQARDEAVLAADDARSEATDSVTFPEVLDQMGLHFNNRQRATFIQALARGDKQDIGQMIWYIQKAFDALVEKKVIEILKGEQ